MVKRKSQVFENDWKEIKRKYVDEWEPSESDINWLLTTVRSMKIGGVWHLPFPGVTFEKIGPDHLRLESIMCDDPLKAMIAIEKTKKVGERAAIRLDIEKAADFIIFGPDHSKT